MTLALCIGANSAVFSVLDAVLLRPLPYAEPDRLATGVAAIRFGGAEHEMSSINGALWAALRENATQVDTAAFGFSEGVNLAAARGAQYVRLQRVTAGFFRVLGVRPLAGREFTEMEDRGGGPKAAVLSYGLWERLYGGDRGVVGRSVLLAGESYTVVGIMPVMHLPIAAEIWTPLRPQLSGEGAGFNYGWLARLRPGVTWEQAGAQVASIAGPVLRRTEPEAGGSARFRLVSFQARMSRSLRAPLSVLMAGVGVVLLIGCANIAGLLLARAAGRRREIAMRLALGGSRRTVIRQLMTESLVLAALGGIAGIGLGYLGIRALEGILQKNFGIWQPLAFDPRVLGATAAVAGLTSLLFGLLPATEASRVAVRPALAENGGRASTPVSGGWPRRALVFVEVGLGVVLLFSAMLLVRSFVNLRRLDPGFDPDGALAARVSLKEPRYLAPAQANGLFTETLRRIRELPGVDSAAVALHLPYERWINMGMRASGSDGAASQPVAISYITPEFLRTLRIPLARGRNFQESDGMSALPVALVNRAFVRDRLNGRDPLGQPVWLGIEKQPREIVGLIGDFQQLPSFGEYGPIGRVPAVLIPASQMPDAFLKLVNSWVAPSWIVRASVPSAGVIQGMRRALESSDPLLPFSEFQSLKGVRSESMARQRTQAVLLGILAALAAILAFVGLYGLVASSVADRRRELGIRIALGAGPARAVRAVAGPVLVLVIAGIVAGAVAAPVAARLLRTLLYGATPGDVLTLAWVGAAMLVIAALATAPALRAARMNPADCLRNE